MSIENPEENLGNKSEDVVEEIAETSAIPEKLSEGEKERIFENAKRIGAWFPIQEGLRIGISKSKLILYAEEILAKKAGAESAEAVANFKGALGRHGFTVTEGQDGKFLVNLSDSGEKKSESPEEQFEKEKSRGPLAAVKLGFRLKISAEKMEEYAKASIIEKINRGNYLEAINILEEADTGGLNMGSSEEIEATVAELFGKCLKEKKYHAAMEIARMKWGEYSKQHKKAEKAYEEDPENKALREIEARREKELEKWSAKISTDASIKDLLDAVEEGDEDLGQSDIFWDAIHDNFNPEVADELLEIQSDPVKLINTKVIAFFEKHGYSKKDIEVFLPVKFKKEKKKK